MLRIVARYTLLSIASFVFFSATFLTVAHAQTIVEGNSTAPEPTQVTINPTVFQHISTPDALQEEQPQTITPTKQPTHKTQQQLASLPVTPLASPTTNPTKTPTPTTTPEPTQIPTPTTAIPTPTTAPTQATVQSNPGGLDANKLFAMVNAHRQSIGLAALQRDERSCSLAASRAPEIAGEIAAGTLHSGMYGRNLPYWNTENAIAMGPESAALNWWLNEPIHRQAIESPSHTHSCVSCTGVYCVQEFTSYQPK